jgi:glutathione S-transferase
VRTLIALPYSPWTEKARWALDHHGIDYVVKGHVPLIGEAALRLKLRRFKSPATVPALIDGHARICDSMAIARHAESTGHGAPLFPVENDAEIARWNAVSEACIGATRALVTRRVLERPDAQAEHLPPFVPAALRGPMAPVARLGARFLVKKYRFDTKDEARQLAVWREGLESLREALGGRDHLLGAFTFADIAMAAALQGVRPPERIARRLGPASLACWSREDLAAEFADLLDWRDRLYAAHRQARKG